MAKTSFYSGTLPNQDLASSHEDAAAAAASAAAAAASAASAAAIPSRTITAGAGLTGGGTLSADRTLAVGAGTGLTVNADDVALTTIPYQRVFANISGGTAAPSANTLTAILDDIIGQSRGMTLFRNASNWVSLALGTTGQAIASNGTDAAWADTINVVKTRKFTSSGTYTPSTGFQYGLFFLLGGGAGGGSAQGNVAYFLIGGGGGAGAVSISVLTAAQIGASKSVTIGAKGTGGASGGNNGNNGGQSQLDTAGALMIANGGLGGQYAGTVHAPPGGAGGSAGTGDLAPVGNPGQTGLYNNSGSGIYGNLGQGAGSFFAGGPPGSNSGNGSATAGASAASGAYGAGGSGGAANTVAANAAGGDGQDGVLFIVEFCKV